MASRGDILDAYRKAGEVLLEHDVKARIKNGYTRIDPVGIAGAEDVAVVFQPMDKLLGAFIRFEDRSGIILNAERPPGLMHMTCAHELGHYFLDHETTADETIEYSMTSPVLEQQADQFAYALIAPQWLIIHIMRKKKWSNAHMRRPEIIYQLSLRLGISYTSAIWTLVRFKIIDQATGNTLLATVPKKLKQSLLHHMKPESWNPDVWHLDDADRDLIIEPRASDKFVIDLPNHAAAGYTWSIDEMETQGFQIEPIVHNVNTHPITNGHDIHSIVGAKTTIRCIVNKDGEIDSERMDEETILVSLVESQPWMGADDSDDRYTFAAEFEEIRNGMSKAEKRRLMNEVKDVA